MFRVGTVFGKRMSRMLEKRAPLSSDILVSKESWKFRVGDVVQVVEGKDTGKTGKVMKCMYKKNKLIVEGINMKVRTQRAEATRAGYFYKKESPIHYSNLAMVDPITQKPTRVKIVRDEANNRVRISATTGAVFPKPVGPVEKREKVFNPATDTPAEEVWKQTYVPKFLGHKLFQAKKMAAMQAKLAATNAEAETKGSQATA